VHYHFLSASCCARRLKTTDAADAEAAHDIGAIELKASKQHMINAAVATAANTYCIIR